MPGTAWMRSTSSIWKRTCTPAFDPPACSLVLTREDADQVGAKLREMASKARPKPARSQQKNDGAMFMPVPRMVIVVRRPLRYHCFQCLAKDVLEHRATPFVVLFDRLRGSLAGWRDRRRHRRVSACPSPWRPTRERAVRSKPIWLLPIAAPRASISRLRRRCDHPLSPNNTEEEPASCRVRCTKRLAQADLAGCVRLVTVTSTMLMMSTAPRASADDLHRRGKRPSQ